MRFRWFILAPDLFTLEVSLLDHINREHIGQIKIFFTVFFANIDPVAAAVELFAKRSYKLAFLIKYNNRILTIRRLGGLITTGPVRDIDQALFIHSTSVRFIPFDMGRRFTPTVMTFVSVFTAADNRRLCT